MKINSLYIASFGGIKGLKLSFSDGFNVIYGDNENGKTTVMSFIKMMFYGNERGSAQIAKNIRKKYTPWDGSAMAGSIDFEHNGKRYRIEREFRSSNSTDKVSLCDLDLGTKKTVAPDVGNSFFGLGAAAFERSVFIGQFGFPESDSAAEGEINSRLSNIALSGEENISFETVSGRISKARLALMSKSGRAGEYDKNLRAAEELKTRLEKSNSAAEQIAAKHKKIEELENEAKELIKKAELLKTKLAAEQDIKNAEKLRELLRLKEELQGLTATLKLNDGGFADEMYLRKLKFCISKVEGANAKAEAKLSEINLLKRSIAAALNPPENATEQNAEALKAEIANAEAKTEALKETLNKLEDEQNSLQNVSSGNAMLQWVLLVIGSLLMVVAGVIFGATVQKLAAALLLTVGAVVLAGFFILFTKKRKMAASIVRRCDSNNKKIENCKAELLSLTEEIMLKKVRLEAILAALNSSAAVIKNQQDMLSEALLELEDLKTEADSELSALLELYSKFSSANDLESVNIGLEKIAAGAEAVREVKQKISFLLGELGNISYEEAAQKLDKIGNSLDTNTEDFDELKQNYESAIADLSSMREQKAALLAEIKAISRTNESPEVLRRKLGELQKIISSQKEFCDICDIAEATLLESFAEVRRSYGSILEKKASEIFGRITGGKYGSMGISKSFDISVEEAENFGSRELGFLSSGTADQAYLSLRLAVSQLICEGEALPIMLDDALAQYDDERAKTALEFLAEYASASQVIMFTCHKSICDAANTVGADLSEL